MESVRKPELEISKGVGEVVKKKQKKSSGVKKVLKVMELDMQVSDSATTTHTHTQMLRKGTERA